MVLLSHQSMKVLLERSQNIGLIHESLHPCNCVDLQYKDRSELTNKQLGNIVVIDTSGQTVTVKQFHQRLHL